MLATPTFPCPHFGICGGCSQQNLTYQQQLARKQQLVTDFFKDLPIAEIQPVMPSPEIFFYRNKMEYSFGNQKDIEIINTPAGQKPNLEKPELLQDFRIHLGLHPRKRFNLVTPTPSCFLLSPESQKIMDVVSAWATDHHVTSYIRIKNSGTLRHLLIREGKNTGQRLVALVTRSGAQHMDDLAERLKVSQIPITSFLWIKHDGVSDVVSGEVERLYWGTPFIHERVGTLNIRVPLKSFMQTNTHASENMIAQLRSWMADNPYKDTLFDLYCGVGSIGLNFSKEFKKVVGIELDASAIEEAFENAKANHIENSSFLVGRVEDLIDQLRQHGDTRHATLVVDPPRMGLHKRVVDTLLMLNLPVMYYVSCNPETLAKDLRALVSKYTIETVQPMDFFPHTDHVETLVRLKKNPTL